jgi:hypothetical protein
MLEAVLGISTKKMPIAYRHGGQMDSEILVDD